MGSVYVAGKLTDPEKVLVDVGTWYYLEKDRKDAKDFFERKVKMVTENIGRVTAVALEKAKVIGLVQEVAREVTMQQVAAVTAAQKAWFV